MQVGTLSPASSLGTSPQLPPMMIMIIIIIIVIIMKMIIAIMIMMTIVIMRVIFVMMVMVMLRLTIILSNDDEVWSWQSFPKPAQFWEFITLCFPRFINILSLRIFPRIIKEFSKRTIDLLAPKIFWELHSSVLCNFYILLWRFYLKRNAPK